MFAGSSKGLGRRLALAGVAICLVGCWRKRDNPHRHEGPFEQLAAGGNVTCGLGTGGRASCWAEGSPATEAPDASLTFITLGADRGCGLDDDGRPTCWGSCGSGCDFPEGRYTQVAAGDGDGACALHDDGRASCLAMRPPPTGLKFRQIDIGGAVACGVTDAATLRCWGPLRYQTTPSVVRTNPAGVVPVDLTPPALERVEQVVLGAAHACARLEEGDVRCWGLDDAGQASPPSGLTARTLDAFGARTCAVDDDDAIVCWGLPLQWNDETYAPPQGQFTDVAVGARHTCGLGRDQSITCWGVDRQGQVSGHPDLLRN